MQHFDRWVSLGSYCITKFQINRHISVRYFGFPDNDTAGSHQFIASLDHSALRRINGSNCLFDWVTVVDYSKMVEAINGGLSEYLLDAQTLTEVKNPEGQVYALKCDRLGVEFPHLFSGYDNWEEQIPGLQPKVKKLVSEFSELKQYRTLYIMHVGQVHLEAGYPSQMEAALSASRSMDAEPFHLLVSVADGPVPNDTDKITFRHLPAGVDHENAPYYGGSAQFNQVFAGFELGPHPH